MIFSSIFSIAFREKVHTGRGKNNEPSPDSVFYLTDYMYADCSIHCGQFDVPGDLIIGRRLWLNDYPPGELLPRERTVRTWQCVAIAVWITHFRGTFVIVFLTFGDALNHLNYGGTCKPAQMCEDYPLGTQQ